MADGIFASGSPPWQQAPICSPEGTGCFSEAFLESSGSQSSHPCERETPLQAASDEGRGDSPLPPPTTQSTRGPGGIPAPPRRAPPASAPPGRDSTTQVSGAAAHGRAPLSILTQILSGPSSNLLSSPRKRTLPATPFPQWGRDRLAGDRQDTPG